MIPITAMYYEDFEDIVLNIPTSYHYATDPEF